MEIEGVFRGVSSTDLRADFEDVTDTYKYTKEGN